MQIPIFLHADKLLCFAVIFARLGAMMLTAPLYKCRSIPLHIRILLAFVLAILVAPFQWYATQSLAVEGDAFFLTLVENILIGASLGLAVMLLFSGVQIAGGLVCRSGQFATEAATEDIATPSGPLASRLLQWMALTVFVTMGGHRLLMVALLDSFQSIPVNADFSPAGLWQTIVLMVGKSFHLALRVAAPIVTALLASTLIVGLASRAVPQINAFTVGFAINIWSTLLILFFSATLLAYLFQDQFHSYLSMWGTMI